MTVFWPCNQSIGSACVSAMQRSLPLTTGSFLEVQFLRLLMAFTVRPARQPPAGLGRLGAGSNADHRFPMEQTQRTHIRQRRRRKVLPITDAELKLMARAAIIGDNSHPVRRRVASPSK